MVYCIYLSTLPIFAAPPQYACKFCMSSTTNESDTPTQPIFSKNVQRILFKWTENHLDMFYLRRAPWCWSRAIRSVYIGKRIMSLISWSKSSSVMLSLMLPMTYIKVSCQCGELSQSSRVNIRKKDRFSPCTQIKHPHSSVLHKNRTFPGDDLMKRDFNKILQVSFSI